MLAHGTHHAVRFFLAHKGQLGLDQFYSIVLLHGVYVQGDHKVKGQLSQQG